MDGGGKPSNFERTWDSNGFFGAVYERSRLSENRPINFGRILHSVKPELPRPEFRVEHSVQLLGDSVDAEFALSLKNDISDSAVGAGPNFDRSVRVRPTHLRDSPDASADDCPPTSDRVFDVSPLQPIPHVVADQQIKRLKHKDQSERWEQPCH